MQKLESEAQSLVADGNDPPTIAREGMTLEL
jgi:hypothetical protein